MTTTHNSERNPLKPPTERGRWGEPIMIRAEGVTITGAVAGHCIDIDGSSWHKYGDFCRSCGFGVVSQPDPAPCAALRKQVDSLTRDLQHMQRQVGQHPARSRSASHRRRFSNDKDVRRVGARARPRLPLHNGVLMTDHINQPRYNAPSPCSFCFSPIHAHCTRNGGALCGDAECRLIHGHSIDRPHEVPALSPSEAGDLANNNLDASFTAEEALEEAANEDLLAEPLLGEGKGTWQVRHERLAATLRRYAGLEALLGHAIRAHEETGERCRNLEDALRVAYECMNYLGDVLNEMDAVEPDDEEYTAPRFATVRAALPELDPPELRDIEHEDDCSSLYEDTRDPNVTDIVYPCDCKLSVANAQETEK
jgi:hypothetical protein